LIGQGQEFRNTVFVIGPDGEEVFRQVKCVPIQFFRDGQPAEEQRLWESPWGKIGLCVCYDLSYTRVTDELVRQGARAIIVPTMDMEQWGERQHLLHCKVAPTRAAEYGVPIFRLCSSGISQHVSASGGEQARAGFPGQGENLVALMQLPLAGSLPVDRYAAWPAVLACAGMLLWCVVDGFRPRLKTQA
jgi:apolipoprotein N-acyltransferase